MSLPDFIEVPRTDPIYNAHGYLTKVPVGAIIPFIDEYTAEGDLVVDCFAGSGMTGVAAMMAGRRAEVSDISVLGRHVGRGFLSTVDTKSFLAVAGDIMEQVRNDAGSLYRTRRDGDGAEVEWNRTIWSYVFRCPTCAASLNFYKSVSITGKARPDKCAKCGAAFKKRDWECVGDVPVAVVLPGVDGKLVEQEVKDLDVHLIAEAGRDRRQEYVPSMEISPEREMYRRCALGRWGLTSTRSFFTDRNALILFLIWSEIGKLNDSPIKDKLMFAFTAILPRASRRYQWGPKRPLNAQNQTYYISPVHFEWNVFELFQRKVNAAVRAQEYRDNSTLASKSYCLGDGVDYRIASADNLSHLDDVSVDYVFTDPPFGSNIFYADMNLFQEAWLDAVTDETCEAVIHTGGTKGQGAAARYEAMLTKAFNEAHRVLKPGAHMSVVFGNSQGAIWGMVTRAIREAGFDPAPVHLALLDKGQRSVKGLASGREGVVTIDLVLTVKKLAGSERAPVQLGLPVTRLELIRRAINRLPEDKRANPSYIYVSTVKEAIAAHREVDDLHLSDVLLEIAARGGDIDAKTGHYRRPITPEMLD